MLSIQKHQHYMNKTAFRSNTDPLSATLLHLGFLLSAPVF